MRKKNVILTGIFLIGILLITSCDDDSVTLFVQKIKGNDLLIVDYDVSYGRDGMRTGKTILKTTKNFNFRRVKELPITFINNISPNKIEVSAFLTQDSDKVEELLKTKKINIDGLEINFKFYNDSYSEACEIKEYKFESFKETADSLFFYGLDKIQRNTLINNGSLGFKKGNIKILSDSLGIVAQLNIEELIIINQVNSTGKNLRSACKRTYYMQPESIIYEKNFSDYGIFKEIKTVPRKKNIWGL